MRAIHTRILRLTVATVVAVATAVTGAPTARADAPPPGLQAALDALVAAGVPGTMALERQDGRTWYATAGVSKLGTQEPMRTSQRYRIGSETKSYISTVVLQLEAEHRLDIDDSVEHWLPGLVPNGDAITLRQLLNHTSGLYDYIDLPFYQGILTDPLRDHQPRDLVAMATAHPPVCAPGTCWSYANTNYILLGLVIDKVLRIPPGMEREGPPGAVHARIIGPLGLADTAFPVSAPDIRGPYVHGYVIGAPPEWGLPPVLDITRENPSWGWTAGAITSTLDDTARFHHALFDGRLLPPAQQQELLTTVPVNDTVDYGLGVFRLRTPCGDAIGHDGATPSHASISILSADRRRQVVVMVNRDVNTWTPEIGTAWGTAVITAFCGEPPTGPSARRAAARLSEPMDVHRRR